ncbi:uncharacterized protein LOC127878348 [Dreissena polymorpha]|uniref:uncharacterized protein LOC127878348 n=1 Tax=Dreissena polymorpha TaxID=45954 RepID=UPI0022653272|nr:uncharacterized protein LOC127878348 [Dreissena polymorpha]
MHHHQEVDQRRPAKSDNYMWHWTLENMGQFTQHMWNTTNKPGSGRGHVFSGVCLRKFVNCLSFIKVPILSYRTYKRLQSIYILPAVDNVWKKTQARLFEMRTGKSLRLGGDARCCSPGHTAKFGSYTLMDLETNHVLDVQLVQSNEVKNSNAMELEGLKRGLRNLATNHMKVTDLTTDRHVKVRWFMREEMENICHWFDVWHMAKGVKNKLLTLGKKKGCEAVGNWAQSIANHLYYRAASSEGNGDLVVAKWLSIGNHVVNRHDGHGDLFQRCLHGPIDRNKKWIKADSKAHKEPLLITERKRFVADIRMLSPTEQTSALEAQHKVVCQFAPKFLSFSYAAMKQRLHLAALHSLANANRKQAETRQGEKRYRLSYPKYNAGHHVVKAVKENCTYDYVDEVMAELLRMKEEYKSDANARAASGNILFSPPPLSSSANRILKSEAVAKTIMEWNAFIAASFYREEVVGSAESKDTLGLIGMNFNQDQKLKPQYCSIWVDKFNPNRSIYMQVGQLELIEAQCLPPGS